MRTWGSLSHWGPAEAFGFYGHTKPTDPPGIDFWMMCRDIYIVAHEGKKSFNDCSSERQRRLMRGIYLAGQHAVLTGLPIPALK